MKLLAVIACMSLAACAVRPMTAEERAYRAQQQRAYQQEQAELARLMVTRSSPMVQQPQQSQPATLQAFWTGRSQFGQSVTGAAGTNCEYNYAGKTFWRMFAGGCPSSVPVQ